MGEIYDFLLDKINKAEELNEIEYCYKMCLIKGESIGYRHAGLITEEQFENIDQLTIDRLALLD